MRGRLLSAGVGALIVLSLGFEAYAAEAPAAPERARRTASNTPRIAVPNPMPANWADPLFTQPFIDVDEWRDKPVRHRYVHGGFKGTDTLFSIYLPAKEQYQGRFFQPVAAVAGDDKAAQIPLSPNGMITNENTSIAFAIASGGYLLESNLGSKTMYDGAGLSMYRASAAVAHYSRQVAAEMYGPHRAFGYTYGGSGGGFKTLAAAENTVGIWDGFVPYVFGSPVSMPHNHTVTAHAIRVLGPKVRDVVDAVDAGGSGDVYATLNEEERGALQEALRMGLPPKALFISERLGYGPLAVLIDGHVADDPKYFAEDFWKLPGYLGANPTESFKKAHIKQHKATITRIIMSDEAEKMPNIVLPMASRGRNVIPAAFYLANMPKVELKGATLTIKSGAAAGTKMSIAAISGPDLVSVAVGGNTAFSAANAIKPGDEVEIDNSIYMAIQTYHRHQMQAPEFPGWDQFRGSDGKPLYPQRELKVRDGGGQTGKFEGRMIAVETLMDEYAWPWQADWYRKERVQKSLGAKTDDQFRLWMIDNAMHASLGPRDSERTRVVAYYNALQQALRDVSAWAEKGTLPAANSVYKVNGAQVEMPATAAERKGVQPVVTLKANGGARTEVKAGERVIFTGTVEVPPGTGKVVEAQWDFDGSGGFKVPGQVKHTDASGEKATVTTSYTFSKPGTYFGVLRAASQRVPDETQHARIQNLARARIVVK